MLSLEQKEVTPISVMLDEEQTTVPLILQEMARSTPDGDTFSSPHKEEETMYFEMNILKQLREVEAGIDAHHRSQPDLDNNPGKSYQQL